MILAKATERPCSDLIQDLSFMGALYSPRGQQCQAPRGIFFMPDGCSNFRMSPVEDVRRSRLQLLVKKHGSMANLCQLLGYARTETAALTRIMNANIRHDRGGKPYNMGGPMARQIEQKLSLDVGWMDTPPSYADLHGENDARTKVMLLMEGMSPDQMATAVRLLDALAQPAKKSSNDH